MFLSPALLAFLAASLYGTGDDRPPPFVPGQQKDYIAWYNEFVSDGKQDNAFALYRGLYPGSSDAVGFPEAEGKVREQLREAITHVWTPKEYPELAAFLKNRASDLRTFEKATEGRYYWHPVSSDQKLLAAVLLNLPKGGRHAAGALLAQSMLKQDAQNVAISNACSTVLKHAAHMRQSGLTIYDLSAVAEESIVYELIRAAASEGILTSDDFATLSNTIRAHHAQQPSLCRWLSVEWAASLDGLQYICPNGKADAVQMDRYFRLTSASPDSPDHNDREMKLLLEKTDSAATAKLIDQYYKDLMEIARGAQTLESVRRFDNYVNDQASLLDESVLGRALVPRFARVCHLEVRVEACRRATMLILALCAHQAKHGKWPATLDKIDTKLGFKGLKKAKVDPLSESGSDFVYSLKDGKPVLYSVADGKNDHGRHDPKWDGGDFVFWPYQR